MSDELDLLGQTLSTAVLRVNSVTAAAEFQQFVALATLVAALLASAHVAWMTWRRLREISSARRVISRLKGPVAFSRHFEATSARLLALPFIKDSWERFARSRASSMQPADSVQLAFSIAPSMIFTRGAVVPEWQRLDKLPFTFLSATLIAAMIGLAGSLTQLLVAGPDPSMAAAYSRQAAQQLSNAGRASFAIIIAGTAGCTIVYLMLRLCWKRIDLALARLIDALDQCIAVQSLGDTVQSVAGHRLGHSELQPHDAQISLLQNRIDASVSKAEAALQKAIDQAFITISQHLDKTAAGAAQTIRKNDPEANSTTPLEQTFDRALSKFRDDISNPIGDSIRALDERISIPLAETLGRLTALGDSLAAARSELVTTSNDMKSRIAVAAEAVEELRDQQSLLIRATAEAQQSVATTLADVSQRIPSSEQLLEIERALHSPIDHINASLRQIREDVATSNSAHWAISSALDNRLRTELASVRLAVQLQGHSRELSQERTIERLHTSFDNRLLESVSRPLAELASSVTTISDVTKRSAIEIAEVNKAIGVAGIDVAHKIGEGFREIDTALETISNDLQRAADTQSEHQRLAAEAAAALTTLNQLATGVALSSQEATAQFMRSAAAEQEHLRRDTTQAVRSVQTAAELTRIKLETAISSLTQTAGAEIEQLSNEMTSGLAAHALAQSKQIGELNDQIATAIVELKSLTSNVDQPLRSSASEMRTLVEDAKSQIEGASAKMQRVSKAATDEARETLDRLAKQSNTKFEAIFARVDQLANRISGDLQTMPSLPDRPRSLEPPIQAQQNTASNKVFADTAASSADQLERTLSALSADLQKAHSMMAAADTNHTATPRLKPAGLRSEHRASATSRHSPPNALERLDPTSKPVAAEDEVATDKAIEQAISQFFNTQRVNKQTAK